MMNKAVIYARVSTKEQEREGYSIPAQLETLREYATKHKLIITRVFKDSETAKSTGRKEFGNLIEYLRNNPDTKIVLVEKTDRLYRNFKDYLKIEEFDINIHLVKEGEILNKESKSHTKFIHGIKLLMAKNYIDNLSEEVRKGQTQMASEGKYPGGKVPLGYQRNSYSKGIELDTERSELVRHFFELYANGEHSINQIHDETKRLNFTYIKSGRFISRSECQRMLKKVFYTGKFNWNGNLYQGEHPAIVDPMLFEQVQNVFSKRSAGSFSRKSFTFSKMIECGECGNTITAEIKKGKYVYYHCTGYGNKHKKKYIPESKINSMFADIVSSVTLPKDFYSFLSNCLEKEFGNRKIKLSQERDRLEVSRNKIESDKKKSFQSMLDGHIDIDFFKTVTNDYQKQLESIDYRLSNLSHSISNDFDVAKKAIELSYQAESLYLKSNPEQKRRILKSLLSNCHLTGVTLYPTYKKAFSIFAKGVESGNKLGDRDSKICCV